MKQTPSRFFPRRTLSATRRYFAGPPLARRAGPVLTRHQMWADAVVRKFTLRLARSRTQSLVFLRSALKWALSVQNFRRISLTLPGLSQQVFSTRIGAVERTFVERPGSVVLRTGLNSAPYQRKKSRGPFQLLSQPEVTMAARSAPASRPEQPRNVVPATSTLTTQPVIRFQERRFAGSRLESPEIRETNRAR